MSSISIPTWINKVSIRYPNSTKGQSEEPCNINIPSRAAPTDYFHSLLIKISSFFKHVFKLKLRKLKNGTYNLELKVVVSDCLFYLTNCQKQI